jgi:hypothetical protein
LPPEVEISQGPQAGQKRVCDCSNTERKCQFACNV